MAAQTGAFERLSLAYERRRDTDEISLAPIPPFPMKKPRQTVPGFRRDSTPWAVVIVDLSVRCESPEDVKVSQDCHSPPGQSRGSSSAMGSPQARHIPDT